MAFNYGFDPEGPWNSRLSFWTSSTNFLPEVKRNFGKTFAPSRSSKSNSHFYKLQLPDFLCTQFAWYRSLGQNCPKLNAAIIQLKMIVTIRDLKNLSNYELFKPVSSSCNQFVDIFDAFCWTKVEQFEQFKQFQNVSSYFNDVTFSISLCIS